MSSPYLTASAAAFRSYYFGILRVISASFLCKGLQRIPRALQHASRPAICPPPVFLTRTSSPNIFSTEMGNEKERGHPSLPPSSILIHPSDHRYGLLCRGEAQPFAQKEKKIEHTQRSGFGHSHLSALSGGWRKKRKLRQREKEEKHEPATLPPCLSSRKGMEIGKKS